MPCSYRVTIHLKDGLIRYCATKTSHNGVNNMWILKNATCLLSSLDQLDVCTAASMQTYDFSTLYTSIPHKLLKSPIAAPVHNLFKKRDESTCYTHIKLDRGRGTSLITSMAVGKNVYSRSDTQFDVLVDNIFIKFGGCLFLQVIGIHMGTNCAPLLADLFLYSYESEF